MNATRHPEQVLQTLLELLAEDPSLRVGQAIANATARRLKGRSDPFSIEDGELLKGLDVLLAEARARKTS
ncbi:MULTISPECIES: hypothetical protein [Corallococcus]|uniref:hypothetical protein n=1 Tax=Corallococcus TaxID=83461 RepID=UPI00117EE59D|nr:MULTISPECIES: hypothetical protein [Corallococcus]NBD07962.1 hypothetical protein [Corallococcus silvisoli]TSC33950.1 hypothetical protein FOF48_02570 [Corallococcus sp. Z5C101001]